jgi:uncharacterized RDD family membrane protein YckC
MLLRYIAAQLYDFFILFALFFASTALCLLINDSQTIEPATRWYQLVLLMMVFLYYAISVKWGGQTIGMRAWGLRLVAADARNLSWSQVIRRLLCFFPSLILACVWIKNPQTLLFQWTKTRIIGSFLSKY